MDMRKRQPIGVELVKRGIVTEKDIEKALEYQREHPNRKLGDILYILDVCDPNKLIETIGEIVGTKGILLNASTIKVKLTDYISLDVAKKNKAVPFEVSSGKIKVCFANTVNSRVIDTVRLLLLNKGLVMESYITFESDIDKILKSLEGVATSNLEAAGRNDTITGLVDSIIKTGMERRASDIHIEPMQNQVRVRYRIDGELFTAAKIEKEKQSQIIGRLKAISNMHQEKQESQDGRILLYEDYNIRVSSQPNIYGEKFVLRLLKKNTVIRNIFKLGFPGTEEELSKNINKKNSITIIAAPTGEGKTIEEMKAGGFGESARLSGKVSGTKKKKKAKDSKSKRKGMDIMTPSGQIKLPGSDEVMQSTGSDITDVLHGSEPTDPIAEETSSATDILEERQKPSHKGYFKIVKEIMLTHTDEVI